MTSNLQIAQELWNKGGAIGIDDDRMKQHAQDCQNFLEFLEMQPFARDKHRVILEEYLNYFNGLRETLKFYKEKGVIE